MIFDYNLITYTPKWSTGYKMVTSISSYFRPLQTTFKNNKKPT